MIDCNWWFFFSWVVWFSSELEHFVYLDLDFIDRIGSYSVGNLCDRLRLHWPLSFNANVSSGENFIRKCFPKYWWSLLPSRCPSTSHNRCFFFIRVMFISRIGSVAEMMPKNHVICWTDRPSKWTMGQREEFAVHFKRDVCYCEGQFYSEIRSLREAIQPIPFQVAPFRNELKQFVDYKTW